MPTMQRLRKSTSRWGGALLGTSLLACGGPQDFPLGPDADRPLVDFDHPDVEGIPELALPLTAATNDCSWDNTNKKIRH